MCICGIYTIRSEVAGRVCPHRLPELGGALACTTTAFLSTDALAVCELLTGEQLVLAWAPPAFKGY